MANPFTKPMCVIITGTSRGYGLCLAETVLQQLVKDSVLILGVRNKNGLENLIKNFRKKASDRNVKVFWVEADLGKMEEVETFIEKCASNISMELIDSTIIIHNAGTLGDLTKKIDQQKDAKVIADYMDVNVTSVFCLTARFLEAFSKTNCFVVNISSLCAIEATSSLGLYCTAKAARDMWFKVLAKERKDVRVLNWAPGPMPTDMSNKLTQSCDQELSNFFKNMLEKKQFVTCSDSATKLVGLIQENKFESGLHIDIYDI